MKLEKLVFFRKNNPRRIHRIKKITQFGLVFIEKSGAKIKREYFIVKREKLSKNHKIKLIYVSKLKYNIIGQNKNTIYPKIMLEMIYLIIRSRLFISHFKK